MVKIEIYTSPTCGACNMMKKVIPGSEIESLVEFKTVYGADGEDNLHFIKSKGFTSIPIVRVINGTKEEFHIGFTPIPKIQESIQKLAGV